MSEKNYPCDSGNCPFSAEGGDACRVNCGLGVDEGYSMEEIEREIRELETEATADYLDEMNQSY